jgi:glutamate-ammonia-ligase adenylyltransferase
LPETDAQVLALAYRLEWQLQSASRLLTDGTLMLRDLGDGARAFLARETGVDGPEALAQTLAKVAGAAEAAISRLLGETDVEGGTGDGPEQG